MQPHSLEELSLPAASSLVRQKLAEKVEAERMQECTFRPKTCHHRGQEEPSQLHTNEVCALAACLHAILHLHLPLGDEYFKCCKEVIESHSSQACNRMHSGETVKDGILSDQSLYAAL